MRVLPWTLALLSISCSSLCRPAAATTPQAAPVIATAARPTEGQRGIHWERSLAAAKAKAARTGKPIFLLHLFGRLDEAFC
jgi:hypothetical protein